MTDEEYSELLSLTRQNNQMLQEILTYVRKVDSQQYRDGEDLRAFLINMCADVAVDNNQRQQRLSNSNQYPNL